MRLHFLLIVTSCTMVLMGCQSQDDASATAVRTEAPADPIAAVVHEFLDAVRHGDTEEASIRLTPLALQKTSELDLNFSPPGSSTARFEVGAVERIEEDKAVVESVWTDTDADGEPNEEKITWALKLSDGKWRISGMAAEIGPNQPPVVMDFENPGQMIAPPETAQSEQSQESSVPQQATRPTEDPFRTGTR